MPRESGTTSLKDILASHALAMVERGETDVSLRAVARAAGVSAMAPYRHFADKAALMQAVAAQGFAMLHERSLAADKAQEPVDALIGQGIAYIRFAREKPALFRLMFVEQAGLGLPPQDCSGAYDLLAARVASIVTPDRQQPATLACWAIVHGFATLALDGRLSLSEEEQRAALEMMTDAARGKV